MKDQEVQQEYFKLQMLDSQMKELDKNVSTMEEQVLQLRNLKESIGKVSNCKEGSTLQAPISPGIYLETELKSSKNVIVNVGSNIFIKKDVKGAQETVQNRVEYVQKIIEELVKDREDLQKQVKKSQEKIQGHV